MFRKMLLGNLIIVILLAGCSSILPPEPTLTSLPTATLTSTPTATSSPTATLRPTKTPPPPTPSPTPIQDAEVYRESFVNRLEAFLLMEFDILELYEVSLTDSVLWIDMQTTYGSPIYQIETSYYLVAKIAEKFLVNLSEDELNALSPEKELVLTISSVSIHFELPLISDTPYSVLQNMSEGNVSIEEWFTLSNARANE